MAATAEAGVMAGAAETEPGRGEGLIPLRARMPRYMLTIAYDGTDFCGWQKQEPFVGNGAAPGEGSADATTRPPVVMGELPVRAGEDRPRLALRTVQHVLEQAVREVVREPIVLVGASRTDAGVHAWGQVGAFTCSGDEADADAASGTASAATPPPQQPPHPPHPPSPPSPRGMGWPSARGTHGLLRAINSRLPDDVLVRSVEQTRADFDPVGDATSKAYSYTLHVGRDEHRPLWDRRYVHQVHDRLDERAMGEAAGHLVGEHDFVSFAALHHGRLTTVRRIFSCAVVRTDEQRLRIDIAGSGFLYNMVRIIAGTLVEVGRGRLDPGRIPAILAAKDRRAAGPTLPPTGLRLEWVRYDGAGGGGPR